MRNKLQLNLHSAIAGSFQMRFPSLAALDGLKGEDISGLRHQEICSQNI